MSNIYDEAIKEVKNIWNGNELTYPKKTIEALERAKNVEELLGLYRKAHIDVLNGELAYQIEALEEELK